MSETITISLTVNGTPCTVETPPLRRLLDVLREDLGLTGTKEGCGEGECGACAVIFNGHLANACLIPMVQAREAEVLTIEGLGSEEAPHPLQVAFHERNGTQCGFCTPGMILAGVDLLRRCPRPSEQDVREGLAGNLCRCTGYVKVVDAVLDGRPS